jgi:hypothetical protein
MQKRIEAIRMAHIPHYAPPFIDPMERNCFGDILKVIFQHCLHSQYQSNKYKFVFSWEFRRIYLYSMANHERKELTMPSTQGRSALRDGGRSAENMISAKNILKSVSLGTVLGLLCFATFYYLYSHSILDYDISDGHGHGPDYGSVEWRGAFFPGILKQSAFFGVLFGVASGGIAAYAISKKKAEPAG